MPACFRVEVLRGLPNEPGDSEVVPSMGHVTMQKKSSQEDPAGAV